MMHAMIPKIARNGSCRMMVWLLVAALLALIACPEQALAAGESGKEGYVQNVPSTPPLSETERGEGWSYNTDYIYSISRALRDSSLPPAAKVPLFIPSIPLDTALLPIALIAGLFGN